MTPSGVRLEAHALESAALALLQGGQTPGAPQASRPPREILNAMDAALDALGALIH